MTKRKHPYRLFLFAALAALTALAVLAAAACKNPWIIAIAGEEEDGGGTGGGGTGGGTGTGGGDTGEGGAAPEVWWAKTVTAGTDISTFQSVAADGAGNVYAAGFQIGTGTFDYGNGAAATGGFAAANAVLVRYDAAGAQWAQTVETGSSDSTFHSVAADGAGNVYAAGYQSGTGPFNYGNGVTAQGTFSFSNVVLVKYDAAGNAQWARTVTAGPDSSIFNSVAVDGAGNVYAAGYQYGTGTFDYGGKTAQGAASGSNVVLVKYNATGDAQWAQTVAVGSGGSVFFSVAADGAVVYAAGYQSGTWTYDYGNSVTAQGAASGSNVVLVKYDAAGNAQWAQTVAAGPTIDSIFNSVAADGAGNIYAAGYQYGTGTYDYGNSVTAQGTHSIHNAVLVRYDAAGDAQWAKTVTAGPNASLFHSVAADGTAVYAAGYQGGAEVFDYGNSVTARGTASGSNVVLVKYDAAGNAQWAQTVAEGSNQASDFNSVAAAGTAVYAAGKQNGTGVFDYGEGKTAQGTSSLGFNAVLVKYPR
jgi:hypothetical protein